MGITEPGPGGISAFVGGKGTALLYAACAHACTQDLPRWPPVGLGFLKCAPYLHLDDGSNSDRFSKDTVVKRRLYPSHLDRGDSATELEGSLLRVLPLSTVGRNEGERGP